MAETTQKTEALSDDGYLEYLASEADALYREACIWQALVQAGAEEQARQAYCLAERAVQELEGHFLGIGTVERRDKSGRSCRLLPYDGVAQELVPKFLWARSS